MKTLWYNIQSKVSFAILYLVVEVLLLSGIEIISPTNLGGPGLDIIIGFFYLFATPVLFVQTLINALKSNKYLFPLIYLLGMVILVLWNIYSYKLRGLEG